MKRMIYQDQVQFIAIMQGWFNIRKSIYVIQHINIQKEEKIRYHLSYAKKKAFDNNQFLINTLRKLEINK